MAQLIDRRSNPVKKSTVNRQRFLRRYKQQIKRAVTDIASNKSITGIDSAEQIAIPTKDISEPKFIHGPGGIVERILPGNEEFVAGDKIKRQQAQDAQGQGGNASNKGLGEDEFIFELSREEFLELYFDDLALPDLVKKQLTSINTIKNVRRGVTASGNPTNINVLRSIKQATSRRIALGASYKKRLKILQQELQELLLHPEHDSKSLEILQKKIELLEKRIKAIPFIDTIDLRYNNKVKISTPSTQAVMFCIMDVSGSMDEPKKDIAKRFFILLYLFLTKNYEKIELVFIRHHTSAKEVNEEEFFYSRETGGTVVSSALELLIKTIKSRYSPQLWNIYVAQASDGDNWNADSPFCFELMDEKIMPLLQYFTYIEIMPRHHQSLWEVYQKIQQKYPNFAMENIDNVQNIYPVFRELFKRKTG